MDPTFILFLILLCIVSWGIYKIAEKSIPGKPTTFEDNNQTAQQHVQLKNTLFCTNCGTSYQASESKKFCESCGVPMPTFTHLKENSQIKTQVTTDKKSGTLKVKFKGCMTSFYATEIYVNNIHRFNTVTMEGFSVDIPLESSHIVIETRETSTPLRTTFRLKELDVNKNYTMILKFNGFMHQYNSDYELFETK